MTITLAQMRQYVRDHIDEPIANYWTDVELNRYIAQSQKKLWRSIYRLKKDYFLSPTGFTLNLVANQYKYQQADGIPVDFFRVTAIRTTTPGFTDIEWVPTDPSSPEFVDGLRADVIVQYPFSFMYAVRADNTIWVAPLPQSVFAAQVDYIQQPTPVAADADTFMPILDPFLDFVEYDATAKALSKGPVGDVGYWKGEAKESWNEIAEALDTPRNDQGPDVVRGFLEGM